MRRYLGLAGFCVLTSTLACGSDLPSEFDSNASEAGTTGTGGVPGDLPEETGDGGAEETGDDPAATGDGDGDSGTGDGDPSTGDGDGDPGLPVCGNGMIEPGEQCDGGELNGISCTDLGYTGGSLGCDPVTCTYDASACTADGGDGGGGTTG